MEEVSPLKAAAASAAADAGRASSLAAELSDAVRASCGTVCEMRAECRVQQRAGAGLRRESDETRSALENLTQKLERSVVEWAALAGVHLQTALQVPGGSRGSAIDVRNRVGVCVCCGSRCLTLLHGAGAGAGHDSVTSRRCAVCGAAGAEPGALDCSRDRRGRAELPGCGTAPCDHRGGGLGGARARSA